ncbi:hypothetical protein CKF72_03900 [Corynebacterium striatum]|jgi:tnp1513|nr:IS30 family transposase [Corynebacterium striatum]PXY04261.1 hypothetical protein CKF55_13855 [Corynebacterium striatum]PXY10611.1 hypothetical protein CKF72_03900 [Corynebacterium striatum]
MRHFDREVVVTRWTPKDVKDAAVERVVAGEAVSLVARDVGVGPESVYGWLRVRGVEPPGRRASRLRDPFVREAVGLVRAGMSISQAAQTVGISTGLLHSRLKKAGVIEVRPRRAHLSPDKRAQAVERVLAGESCQTVADAIGVHPSTVYGWIRKQRYAKLRRQRHRRTPDEAVVSLPDTGKKLGKDSVMPAPMKTQAVDGFPSGVFDKHALVGRGRRLTVEDRVAIEAGCRVGDSARAIAQKINRHHSVVAREITRNGWKIVDEDGTEQLRYNAHNAAVSTAGRMVRPKLRKLDESPTLRGVVVDCLARRWSPGRISAWLEHAFSDDESMRISHEAIYSALYIQGKGSLRAELEEVMKTKDVLIRGGSTRKRRARNAGVLTGRPWIKGAEITHRSPEADDRAIPGHWEGDLVIGKGGKSALITLVERTSRYTLLGHLPDEHSSHTVVATLQDMVKDLNTEQLKTITWDQGAEMAVTAQVQIKDGCQVFFCEPHSPWQRPTNENTNGEIRRRFYKKGTDFATVTPEHVAWVQNELNETPRQILGGATPREILNELFKRGASTA